MLSVGAFGKEMPFKILSSDEVKPYIEKVSIVLIPNGNICVSNFHVYSDKR